MPATSLLQVPRPHFSKVYDYARDMIEHGKRLILTKTESAKDTEQKQEIHKNHQQVYKDTVGQQTTNEINNGVFIQDLLIFPRIPKTGTTNWRRILRQLSGPNKFKHYLVEDMQGILSSHDQV